jgi:hypothetical protein
MVVLKPRSDTIIQQPDLGEGFPIALPSCHDWGKGSWSTPHPGGGRFEEFIIGGRILPLSKTKPDHFHQLKQHSVRPGKIVARMSEMLQARPVGILVDGGLVHNCQEQLLPQTCPHYGVMKRDGNSSQKGGHMQPGHVQMWGDQV